MRLSESVPPDGTSRDTADWVVMKKAHKRVKRNRSTVYKWVIEGSIRSFRPGRDLWLYVPDLLARDREAIRKVKVANGEETA